MTRYRTYDSMPQSGDLNRYEQPMLMGLEEVVVGSLRYDSNCLEWLGYDISKRVPRMIPDGYRYDSRNDIAIPPGYAFCTGCQRVHPLSEFHIEKRNTGRGKTKSRCKHWRTQEQKMRDQKRMIEKLSTWKRG
jgi:hypothetical protein